MSKSPKRSPTELTDGQDDFQWGDGKYLDNFFGRDGTEQGGELHFDRQTTMLCLYVTSLGECLLLF